MEAGVLEDSASPGGVAPGVKAISQKVQARTLDGSTAPHCKQVLVTGEFCAADAHTPVGVYEKENNTQYACKTPGSAVMFRKSYRYFLVRAEGAFALRTPRQTRLERTKLKEGQVAELEQGW